MKELKILGAGQYGSVVKEIAELLGYETSFFDDSFPEGKQLKNVGESNAVVAIGNTFVRRQWNEKIKSVTLIHPKAVVSPSVKLGKGCIIEAGAVINSNAVIGNGCIIMSNVVIGHDAVVGAYCQLKYGCVITEGSEVSDNTKIDCNVVYRKASDDDFLEQERKRTGVEPSFF